MKRFAAFLFIAVLGQAAFSPALSRPFDYYALALSWSPTHCASNEGEDDHPQCSPGRRFAFVAHGLWPQYEHGWPENCDTRERWVPDERIADLLPIMPSKRLIIHQWRKHGTCSGLTQQQYFNLARELFQRVKVPDRYVAPTDDISVSPDELIEDFEAANAWLEPSMISVDCGSRRGRSRLREIRICFSREGEPVACGANEQRQCRADTLIMPPVR